MKNFKAYIAGIVSGAILFSLPIYADEIWNTISVITNGVNVKVDGKLIDSPNFVYNDTTYVPLRQAAEMLGKQVTWSAEENTAYIGKVPEKDDNTPVATVNGKPITVSEFIANAYNSQKSKTYLNNKPVSEENKISILNEIVKAEAVNQHAKAEGFKLSEGEQTNLDTKIEQAKEQQSSFSHMSYETYKSLTTKYANYTIYVQSLLDSIATDEEAKAYYDKNKDEYKEDSYTTKHILIKTIDKNNQPLTGQDLLDAKEKANEIYLKIKNGGDFDKLMNEYSQDEGLKTNPDGYTFDKDDSVYPIYKATAYSLKPGEVCEPVKSEAGYHIIKLISFNNDIKPFDKVKESIKYEKLAYKKYLELEDEIVKNSDIVINKEVLSKIELK